MRSQIGACVISLSNIYIICFETMQNGVRKRAKDGFVQKKGGFFLQGLVLFSSSEFLTAF